jgi:tRNA A-37 threonylcarbamoyl transferase component Bud32
MDIEDPDQLAAYLGTRGVAMLDAPDAHRILAGGISNKTVRIRRIEPPDWVLKQALPKLRVTDDWYCDPVRIHREAEALRMLGKVLPAGTVPAFVFEDPIHHVLAIEAVPVPNENWKALLLAGEIDPAMVDQFGATLGRLHAGFDGEKYPHDGALRDRTFFESLRIAPYYETTAARAPEAAPFLDDLVARTRRVAVTLVHGDYSPKNVLVHAGRLVVLDHEVAHIGDPAFDVGFALTHFLSKANHLPEHRSRFAGAAHRFWAAYRAEVSAAGWFAGVEGRAVHHLLACLLARVEGRSPLEYLTPLARRRQREAALSMIATPPMALAGAIDWWTERMEACL